MKLLVTGANGFVGSALCVELIKQGLTVFSAVRDMAAIDSYKSVVVGDINNATNWDGALSGVDVVVHLAARVHVMNDDATNPLAEYRKINVEGTLNLARQAAAAGVKRFIFLSSVKVNGESTNVCLLYTSDVYKRQDP